MTTPLVRLDRPRELGAALGRMRWNPHVLGAAAYAMEAHPANAAWGVPPVDTGHHLRWSLDPRRGTPPGGFLVYRRSHKTYAAEPTHELHFAVASEQRGIKFFPVEVGEKRPATFRHLTGFSFTPRMGLDLPPDSVPLDITLPTSGRAIALLLTNVPAGAEVRATHARHLVHYARTTRQEPDWVVVCHDPADELHVLAPGARVVRLNWIRVPGDLAGWQPMARFPALGTAPLDRAGIASRLDSSTLSEAERGEHLARVLDSIQQGPAGQKVSWQADVGTSGLEVHPGILLSALTLRPQLAWAFGRYLIDPEPATVPADYLIVGAWIDASYTSRAARSNGAPIATSRVTAAARAAAPSASLPFIIGAPVLDDVIDALAGGTGLLYFAPCFAVSPDRAWEPPFARIQSFEAIADEARRQLDEQGRALLELPLRSAWTLHQTNGFPLVAMQQTPLAHVTLTGPGADATPRAVVSNVTDGSRATIEVVSAPLAALPGTAEVSLSTLDLFGHLTGPPTAQTRALPAELYPVAPPPIGLIPELVPPAVVGDPPNLRVSWLWGGRSRLFHPNVREFVFEWVQDTDIPAGSSVQDTLRNGTSLTWRALARPAAVPPTTVQITQLDAALTGQSSAAILRRDGADFVGGVRTDLRLAPGATGRLDGWTLQLGSQSFVVVKHTLGDDAWVYVALPGGAAGTPFAGFAEEVEQAFGTPWSLIAPGSAPQTTAIARFAADPVTMKVGSLLTQGARVFGVLARVPGPPAQALFDVSAAPQEPGAPPPPRPMPVVGAVQFDAPLSHEFAGVAVAAPTPSHARREIWVRVRTVDFLGRVGPPGTPTSTAWAKIFPLVPAEGPAVVRRSPPNASGQCKLLVNFARTLADHGYVLYRASDTQLAVLFERAKRRVANRGAAANPVFFLPPGFQWPAGGPQRPEDVTDPLKDFAGNAMQDSLRNFYNLLQLDEGGGRMEYVYRDAFERRGRMTRPGQPDAVFTAAANATMELEDVVDRAGNKYLFLVRPLDRAHQEGPPSGVSLPGQGYDISSPAAPELIPVLVTADEMIVRWLPVRDARVTRYRVTRIPMWQGAPAAAPVEGPPNQFASPIRLEGDRVALPGLVLAPVGGGAATAVTSVKTRADNVEHLADGFVMDPEQQFLWWCAAGNRALVVANAVGAGTIRDRVPAAYGLGVADGSSVNPAPLLMYRGVLDGEPLQLAAGSFGSLLAPDAAANNVDRTPVGTWYDGAFLTCPPALEEGEAVVIETAAPDGTRRTFGRCPAAPGLTVITVTNGVIPLDAVAVRLAAGDRPSGVFRASGVTVADAAAAPDPRRSSATDLIDGTSWYKSGFVRRLRNGVPVVIRWRRVSDGGERFLVSAPGGRPLRFLDGSLVVPPWDQARETLSGIFERAAVSISGATVAVPTGARNLVADIVGDATTGRIVTVLPDGTAVRVRLQDATEMAAHFEPLGWRGRRLPVGGLFGDGVFDRGALYTLEPDATGQLVPRTDRDRLAATDLTADRASLVAKGLPPDGSTIQLEYDGDGVARTVDPRRLEWSTAVAAADVGRSWEIRVEALCDFDPPVGVVTSRASVTRVEIAPPPDITIRITSAQWTAARQLEVSYSGPAALTYRVEAVSGATGRTHVLADPAAGGVVTTATAADGTNLPLNEGLTIRVRAWFPNAAERPYFADPLHVASLLPESPL